MHDTQAASLALFYHPDAVVEFPAMSGFGSVSEAREALDALTTHMHRLLAPYGERHCILPYQPLPTALAAKLKAFTTALRTWLTTFRCLTLPQTAPTCCKSSTTL